METPTGTGGSTLPSSISISATGIVLTSSATMGSAISSLAPQSQAGAVNSTLSLRTTSTPTQTASTARWASTATSTSSSSSTVSPTPASSLCGSSLICSVVTSTSANCVQIGKTALFSSLSDSGILIPADLTAFYSARFPVSNASMPIQATSMGSEADVNQVFLNDARAFAKNWDEYNYYLLWCTPVDHRWTFSVALLDIMRFYREINHPCLAVSGALNLCTQSINERVLALQKDFSNPAICQDNSTNALQAQNSYISTLLTLGSPFAASASSCRSADSLGLDNSSMCGYPSQSVASNNGCKPATVQTASVDSQNLSKIILGIAIAGGIVFLIAVVLCVRHLIRRHRNKNVPYPDIRPSQVRAADSNCRKETAGHDLDGESMPSFMAPAGQQGYSHHVMAQLYGNQGFSNSSGFASSSNNAFEPRGQQTWMPGNLPPQQFADEYSDLATNVYAQTAVPIPPRQESHYAASASVRSQESWDGAPPMAMPNGGRQQSEYTNDNAMPHSVHQTYVDPRRQFVETYHQHSARTSYERAGRATYADADASTTRASSRRRVTRLANGRDSTVDSYYFDNADGFETPPQEQDLGYGAADQADPVPVPQHTVPSYPAPMAVAPGRPFGTNPAAQERRGFPTSNSTWVLHDPKNPPL